MQDPVHILSMIDGLIAELRNGDPQAIEEAKSILHGMIDCSGPDKLILLLIPVKRFAEKAVRED